VIFLPQRVLKLKSQFPHSQSSTFISMVNKKEKNLDVREFYHEEISHVGFLKICLLNSQGQGFFVLLRGKSMQLISSQHINEQECRNCLKKIKRKKKKEKRKKAEIDDLFFYSLNQNGTSILILFFFS
jgi:hypothetical protein